MAKRNKKYFHFSYSDYATVFDLEPETLRNYASQGKFDPHNIKSVIKFYVERNKEKNNEQE